MKPKHLLILGLLLLFFYWPRLTDNEAHTPWLGPVGTRWAGTELRGMQRWGGYFSNGSVVYEYVELRCINRPFLRTRSADYWPGADWNGWAEWKADKVVYQPGRAPSKAKPISLPAPWWLPFCPN